VKPNGLEFTYQVLVPDMTCLFLAIDVLVDLEDVTSEPAFMQART